MKRAILSIVSAVALLLAITTHSSTPRSANLSADNTAKTSKKVTPTCDGTDVTSDCVVDGVTYRTYIYHAGVAEQSHTETDTSYKQELSGYCTLCGDGTYSPSCATGRGACSYHEGVAQWNAPRYRQVPVTTTRVVIDAPAQDAYYEKVVK